MDEMAKNGITGIMDSIAPGIIPGSDTAHLSILGLKNLIIKPLSKQPILRIWMKWLKMV